MNNAEWMIKHGKNFSELTCRVNFVTDKFEINLDSKIIGEIGIGTISKNPVLVWLDMEHNEPILDDAERKYLSEVIRPFRDDVQFIMKYKGCFSSRVYEEIAVWYRDKIDGEKNYCMLPKFEKGTMYKNMEVSRHYTLEELGL